MSENQNSGFEIDDFEGKMIPDPIEQLMDEDNEDDILLYDEENNEVAFRQVAVIPMDEKVYAILKPVVPFDGMADDEALVFAIEDIEGEYSLVVETDADIADAVFEKYNELLRQEGIVD